MPRPRVLVVTDDAEAAGAICATLTAEGCDVDIVSRVADAVGRYAQHRYHLLIASIHLSDLDGRDLYFRARWPSAYPHVIFLVPAGAPIPPPAAGLTAPVAPVLPMPVTPEALRDLVRRALSIL